MMFEMVRVMCGNVTGSSQASECCSLILLNSEKTDCFLWETDSSFDMYIFKKWTMSWKWMVTKISLCLRFIGIQNELSSPTQRPSGWIFLFSLSRLSKHDSKFAHLSQLRQLFVHMKLQSRYQEMCLKAPEKASKQAFFCFVRLSQVFTVCAHTAESSVQAVSVSQRRWEAERQTATRPSRSGSSDKVKRRAGGRERAWREAGAEVMRETVIKQKPHS